jgi:two-component system response regulator YesN
MIEPISALTAPQRSVPSDKVYRVMIADYDPLMRETLASVISKIDGFSVTHSIGNLQLVIDQFRRDTPDIVIIELDLPWMTGLDIAKEILAMDPETAIYTISTYDRFEISQFAMEIKLAGHILKPVSPKSLMEIFKHHKNVYKLKPSPQLALLSSIVRERTFDRFYYGLNDIAVSLQEEAGRNTANLNNKLSNIHSSLSEFNHMNPFVSPFPISEPTLLYIDKVVELCLFNIINS